jgi:hypothetical protein
MCPDYTLLKRTLTALVLLTTVLTLFACGGSTDDPTAPGPDTTTPPGPDTTPPGPDTTTPPGPDTTTPPPTSSTLGSVIYELAIELDVNAGDDLDGDGEGDNALGGMFTNIETLTGSVNVNVALANNIASGILAVGLAWPGVEEPALGSPLSSAGFSLYVLNLVDFDGDPATTDVYKVGPGSFVEGTNIPKTLYPGATITNGALAAGPGSFNLGFPYYDVTMKVVMGKASVTGMATKDEAGVALSNGRLTGAVASSSFLDWINAYVVSDWCSCLKDMHGDLIDKTQGLTAEACIATPDSSACDEDEDGVCILFANQCTLIMPVMGAFADIDTDADGVPDSFSALMHLKAKGTTIAGLPE